MYNNLIIKKHLFPSCNDFVKNNLAWHCVSTNMKIGLMTKTGANPLPVQISAKGPGTKYSLVDSESQDNSLSLADISVPVIDCFFQASHSGSH